MSHDDTGHAPDEVLEKEYLMTTEGPPPSFTDEYHPSVADEAWRHCLAEADFAVGRPLDDEPPGGPEHWQLARIMRAYAELADAEARLETYYKRAKAAMQQRRDALDFRRYQEARALTAKLIGNGKRKSIETPFGRVGFRTHPERLVVVDEDALITAWMGDNVPLPVVKLVQQQKPVMAELQKLFKETGEIPPGCAIQPAREEFYMS